jgi:hypothetical protein
MFWAVMAVIVRVTCAYTASVWSALKSRFYFLSNVSMSSGKSGFLRILLFPVIKSPKRDLLFLLSFLLSLPNNVWRLIVFAPFLIIIIYYYYYYSSFFLSFRATWTSPRQISETTGQNFMMSSKFDMWVDKMSRIDSRHWKFSTGHHFQNGRHNTAQIQHCSISTKFHM